MLVGAATPEALATAPEMATYASALMEAIGRRDLAATVEVNMRAWVDGPHRTPEQIDPELRAKIASMQRDAFINTRDLATTWSEEPLVSDLAGLLAQIIAPTLVILGQLDTDFIFEQARLLANQIPEAQLEPLPDTGHTPSVERPEAFGQLVIPFLARSASSDRT